MALTGHTLVFVATTGLATVAVFGAGATEAGGVLARASDTLGLAATACRTLGVAATRGGTRGGAALVVQAGGAVGAVFAVVTDFTAAGTEWLLTSPLDAGDLVVTAVFAVCVCATT